MPGGRFNDADLLRADLFPEAALPYAQFQNARLKRANLVGSDLSGARLCGAKLHAADLTSATLIDADFSDNANLRLATLDRANLSSANLTGAKLAGASLERAILVETQIERADLSNCCVYGIAAWDVKGTPASQRSLSVFPIDSAGKSGVTVDDIKVAQFIYLLVKNPNIRDVIDTVARKAVLILGRFSDGRKAVLEAISNELRRLKYVPIVFDFERAEERDFTETIMILAGMSLFVVADITRPRSTPLEMQAAVPNYMIPFVPILQSGEEPFSMFKDLWVKYRQWVLQPLEYDSIEELTAAFEAYVVKRALKRHSVLVGRRKQVMHTVKIPKTMRGAEKNHEQLAGGPRSGGQTGRRSEIARGGCSNCCRIGHRFFPPTKGFAAACFIHEATWCSSRSSTDASSTPRVDLPIPIGVTGGSGLISVPRMNISFT